MSSKGVVVDRDKGQGTFTVFATLKSNLTQFYKKANVYRPPV